MLDRSRFPVCDLNVIKEEVCVLLLDCHCTLFRSEEFGHLHCSLAALAGRLSSTPRTVHETWSPNLQYIIQNAEPVVGNIGL